MWYRIEIEKDGTILSCALVENRGVSASSSVVYVDADSTEKAVESALQWRASYLERVRENKARHRRGRIEKGQCVDCVRNARPGSQRCERCDERNAQRVQERKKGFALLKPGPKPGTVQGTALRVRLEVLQQVLEKHENSSKKQLTRWLKNEIVLCENRIGVSKSKEEVA